MVLYSEVENTVCELFRTLVLFPFLLLFAYLTNICLRKEYRDGKYIQFLAETDDYFEK